MDYSLEYTLDSKIFVNAEVVYKQAPSHTASKTEPKELGFELHQERNRLLFSVSICN